MKKIIILTFCALMLISLSTFSCCAWAKADTVNRSVVDLKGNEIQLPETIERYGILYSSAVPMCGMLDENLSHLVLCPTLYADWTYRLFPDLNDHAVVVDKRAVTAEQIIESGAQVVFWSSSTHDELVESLESLGVACVNVAVSNADDLMQAMDIIADTLGTEYAKNQVAKYHLIFDKYQQYAIEHAAAIPENERLSVLVLNDDEDTTGFGENAYEFYWAGLAGFHYILPSDDGADKVTLTMEQIYEFDPDIIVLEGFFDEDTLADDPAWKELRAVQNKLVVAAPSVLDTWSKPGSETPLQYVWAMSKFYPDYASDIDMVAETISFYEEMYQYDMSEDEANEVLAGHRIIFGE